MELIRRSLPRTFHSVARRPFSTGPVTAAYQTLIQNGAVRRDETQIALASKLDALHSSLASSDSRVLTDDQLTVEGFGIFPGRSFQNGLSQTFVMTTYTIRNKLRNMITSSETPPRGLYIHGSVGVGKSFLMDLFYDVCGESKATLRRKRKRAHFHEFMLDVHQRIHEFKKIHPKKDPIPPVALGLAKEARLFCFDEFQVTDIADAMIMKRLFTLLFDMGVVVVSTSNRPPDTLYEGGLNRSLFLPFIDTIHETFDVVPMDKLHDYRRDICLPDIPYSYFWPSNDPNTKIFLNTIFGNDGRSEVVPVMMGRKVEVSRANEKCGWFDFKEVCHQPLGAADYISLSHRFPIIIVENVPQLGANQYNEARRFVTLIDAMYESKTRLVISAHVSLEHLFVEFDTKVESNDGDEEMAVGDLTGIGISGDSVGVVKENAIQNQRGDEESWVNGEGGSSSSSSTTMIRTQDGDVEWSATGRVGVSLAQLSAVKDVAFSFRRAESRLAEMSGEQWGR